MNTPVWFDRRLRTVMWIMLIGVSGCGDGSPPVGSVAGLIAIEGIPLEAGYVTFEDSTRGLGASASVNAGIYEFDAPLGVGTYKVYVQPPSLVPSAATAAGPEKGPIPPKYLFVGSSPLEATVVEGPNEFVFELER